MGTKTIQLLLKETVSGVDTTKFWIDWVHFNASAPGYLIQNLPFNESLIQHAQYLNRRNRTDVKCSNANWSILDVPFFPLLTNICYKIIL